MSSFILAMDKNTLNGSDIDWGTKSDDEIVQLNFQTKGVNNSDVYTEPIGEQQELLALFGMLNRDLEEGTLVELLDRAVNTSDFVDLVVLAFHTRDIREGKGERDLFYRMFNYLHDKYPDALLRCLKHIPFYGCWLDLQKMYSMTSHESLKEEIIEIYVNQLKSDELNNNTNELSLAAKWAPREGKQFDELAKRMAKKYYPCSKNQLSLKYYRQLLSKLNARLDTTEMKMCHDIEKQHRFSQINPSRVPSRCLKMKKKAFLFENKKSKDVDISSNDVLDRTLCKTNFQEHVEKAIRGQAKVNGKTLMPHEFVLEFSKGLTQDEINILEAQWIDLRKSILEKGSLGKVVVMSDVSGSMDTMSNVRPMDVSIGLGLLCAECGMSGFRDRILTFESSPNWVNLEKCTNIYEKYEMLKSAPWGGSTNFEGAMNLILDTLVNNNIPLGDEPDILLCITDMGFDEAVGYGNTVGFETHIDRIKREFKEKGNWRVPTIVIWNVSGSFKEYHHKSDTEGVCTISGWSAKILKYFMEGENVIEKIKSITPYKIMRDVLDDKRYDRIRETF